MAMRSNHSLKILENQREEKLRSSTFSDSVCDRCQALLDQLDEEYLTYVKAGKYEDGQDRLDRGHAVYQHTVAHVVQPSCTLCSYISEFIRGTNNASIASEGFRIFAFDGLAIVPDNPPKAWKDGEESDGGVYDWRSRYGSLEVSHDDHKKSPDSTDDVHKQSRFIDFAPIRGKIQLCRDTHLLCQRALGQLQKPPHPIKLINCHTRQLVIRGPDDVYLTLSYVWGQGPQADLDPIPVNGNLPDTLPVLIEDALEITKKLGFDFLWIDRYCIDQSNRSEVAAQVSQMDLVYGGASCCIVPISAQNPSAHIPGVFQPRSYLQELQIASKKFMPTLPSIDGEIQSSLWNTRGWTYQEAVMSRQRFFIGNNRVFWNCLSDTFCDQYSKHSLKKLPYTLFPTLHRLPNDVDLELEEEEEEEENEEKEDEFEKVESEQSLQDDLDESRAISLADHVWRHIRDYNERGFTDTRDVLFATEGVFNALKTYYQVPVSYPRQQEAFQTLYGLPICYHITESNAHGGLETQQRFSARLLESLVWQVVESYASASSCGSRRLGVPSWSWASRVGRIQRPFDEPEIQGSIVREIVPGISIEVETNIAGRTERLNWESFCRQELNCHSQAMQGTRDNPLTKLQPVLIIHGAVFPVLDQHQCTQSSNDVGFCAVPPSARDDQAEFDSKMCIDFGNRESIEPQMPDLAITYGVLLAVPCIFFRWDLEEEELNDEINLGCILVEGTDSNGVFERIGYMETRYPGTETLLEMFTRICERYPRYRQLSETGLRLV